MSLQTAHNPGTPSAQVVGNAFVQQYYHILHTSPELVHRFYQDSSVLSRPDTGGQMTTVATMQGINDKILSLNFMDYTAEIETADAQKSYKDGVTVLVTGSLMGKDNLKRKFAQSFFLAPQDNGYFVLNDVFRFVEDSEPLENHTVNGIDNTSPVPVIPDSEPSRVLDPSAPDPETLPVEQDKISEKANKPVVDSAERVIYEKEIVLESQSHSNGNDVSIVVESSSSVTQEDTPKKSYASIVKVERGSAGPTKVYIPTNTSRVTPKKLQEKTVPVAPVTENEALVPSSNESPESGNAHEEVEGHSVYIRNLPHNLIPAQLEAEFKKFGPIKQGGIQVRFNKQQGYCFGFIEFESPSSVNNAVQASPLSLGGRQVIIEAKRTSRVGGGRGRFSSGRTGFRSDSFRGRGNYGGGRGSGRNEYGNRGELGGQGRNEYGNRGEFSGQGRNEYGNHRSEYGGQGRSSGRGEGYHQSRGRGGRSSGQKHITNST